MFNIVELKINKFGLNSDAIIANVLYQKDRIFLALFVPFEIVERPMSIRSI